MLLQFKNILNQQMQFVAMTSLPESGQIGLLIQQFLQKTEMGKKKKASNHTNKKTLFPQKSILKLLRLIKIFILERAVEVRTISFAFLLCPSLVLFFLLLPTIFSTLCALFSCLRSSSQCSSSFLCPYFFQEEAVLLPFLLSLKVTAAACPVSLFARLCWWKTWRSLLCSCAAACLVTCLMFLVCSSSSF